MSDQEQASMLSMNCRAESHATSCWHFGTSWTLGEGGFCVTCARLEIPELWTLDNRIFHCISWLAGQCSIQLATSSRPMLWASPPGQHHEDLGTNEYRPRCAILRQCLMRDSRTGAGDDGGSASIPYTGHPGLHVPILPGFCCSSGVVRAVLLQSAGSDAGAPSRGRYPELRTSECQVRPAPT